MKELRKVYVTSDDDGHNYVIPYEMKESFFRLLKDGEEYDDYEDFNDNFSKYRIGGDINLVQLYAEI